MKSFQLITLLSIFGLVACDAIPYGEYIEEEVSNECKEHIGRKYIFNQYYHCICCSTCGKHLSKQVKHTYVKESEMCVVCGSITSNRKCELERRFLIADNEDYSRFAFALINQDDLPIPPHWHYPTVFVSYNKAKDELFNSRSISYSLNEKTSIYYEEVINQAIIIVESETLQYKDYPRFKMIPYEIKWYKNVVLNNCYDKDNVSGGPDCLPLADYFATLVPDEIGNYTETTVYGPIEAL